MNLLRPRPYCRGRSNVIACVHGCASRAFHSFRITVRLWVRRRRLEVRPGLQEGTAVVPVSASFNLRMQRHCCAACQPVRFLAIVGDPETGLLSSGV